jgi:hypothetical protein
MIGHVTQLSKQRKFITETLDAIICTQGPYGSTTESFQLIFQRICPSQDALLTFCPSNENRELAIFLVLFNNSIQV